MMLMIISMLAVWRATYMLQEEKGPLEIFRKLQAWFWSDPVREGGIKDGLRCFYCTSVWISIPFAIAVVAIDPLSPWWSTPMYMLGISAGAIIINLFHSRLEQ